VKRSTGAMRQGSPAKYNERRVPSVDRDLRRMPRAAHEESSPGRSFRVCGRWYAIEAKKKYGTISSAAVQCEFDCVISLFLPVA